MQTSDMIEDSELERVEANCLDCGKAFPAGIVRSPFNRETILVKQVRCNECVETHRQTQIRIASESSANGARRDFDLRWDAICPPEFKTLQEGGNTDPVRLASEQPQLPTIVAHPLSATGLILRGATGTAKTRCMYRLMRSYAELTPRRSIVAMSAGRFDREARDAAGMFTLSEWFERLARVDVLFLDDIGKGKWTPATAGQFWELVDERTKRQKPIFLTTNCSGEALVQSLGMDKDAGDPLLRRLRENCKVLVLKRP